MDVDYKNENAADSMSIRPEISGRLNENSVPDSRDAEAKSSSRTSWPAKGDCLAIDEQGQDKKEADRINQRNEEQPMQTNTSSSPRLLPSISLGETAFGHHSLPWSCQNLSTAPGDLIPPPIESAQFLLSRDYLMQANKATAPPSDSAYESFNSLKSESLHSISVDNHKLSALSIVINLNMFICFTSGLVRESRQIYGPVQTADFYVETKRLFKLCKGIKAYLDAKPQSPSRTDISKEAEALEAICNDCIAMSDDIISQFNKLSLDSKENQKYKNLRAALKTVWSEEEIDDTANRLKIHQKKLDSYMLPPLKYESILLSSPY
jgi:hypothetical protein